MSILIYGCGNIGSGLASKWKANQHKVYVTTRDKDRAAELQQLSDNVLLIPQDPLPLNQIDTLIVAVAPSSENDSYQSTYLDTARLLHKQLKDTPYIKQIIYTSSTSVYGDYNHAQVVHEDSPLLPLHPNTQILIEAEKTLLDLATPNRSVCIYRLGEIIGTHSILDRLSRPLPTNGTQVTNMVDREDVLKAIDFAIAHNLNGIYNLIGDLHISRKELYDTLTEERRLPAPQWSGEKSSHSSNKWVSNSKIKSLGFKFSPFINK